MTSIISLKIISFLLKFILFGNVIEIENNLKLLCIIAFGILFKILKLLIKPLLVISICILK